MSTDETPLDLAKAAQAALEHRVTVSRLGKSIFRETDQDIIAMREASRAIVALLRRSEVPDPSDEPNPITLEDLSETSTSLKDLVDEARSEAAWCCDNGCGSGACETCPCCSASYCVSGFDGVPDDPEDREHWLEVASEYNPVAAALRAAEAQPQGEPSDALDLERLEKLANAATPGPWEYIFGGPEQDEDGSWYEPTESGVRSGDWENDFPHADAEFVAAVDPQTVLALIAALRAAGGVR